MTTLQQRYEQERPWGQDDLDRAAEAHADVHGGIIAEAALTTRTDGDAAAMMQAANSNDTAGGSVDFQDAVDEEDEDLLADPEQAAAPDVDTGSLIRSIGDRLNNLGRRRPDQVDTDGDGVPDQVDTDDDDDGVPDSVDPDHDPGGDDNSQVAPEPQAEPSRYEQNQQRMDALRDTLASAPESGGAEGLDFSGHGRVPDPGRRQDAYIDPRYRQGGDRPRRGRGLGQFRFGR